MSREALERWGLHGSSTCATSCAGATWRLTACLRIPGTPHMSSLCNLAACTQQASKPMANQVLGSPKTLLSYLPYRHHSCRLGTSTLPACSCHEHWAKAGCTHCINSICVSTWLQVLCVSAASDRLYGGRAQNGEARAAWLDAVLHCTRTMFLQRLRTPGDRQHVASIITTHFAELGSARAGSGWLPLFLRQPDQPGRAAVDLTPGDVTVGRACCVRAATQPLAGSGEDVDERAAAVVCFAGIGLAHTQVRPA